MSLCHLPIYDPQKCTFFALGRNAMFAACQVLRLKPGDEVLTPAFDCDGALHPFRVLGHHLRFFRSNPYTFEVDLDDLQKRITPRTKLIHIINHFGFPQPWEEVLSLRQKFGIPILEDNAYSLFSTYQGRHFGTFGDISIFSLRKNLPLLEGGMLRMNNPTTSSRVSQKKNPWIPFIDIQQLVRRLIKRQIEPPPLYSDSEPCIPSWPLRDGIGKDFSHDYLRPMSKMARIQLSLYTAQQYQEIAARKREQYLFLVHELSDIKNIKILWPNLPEGSIPFNFSFLLSQNRDAILKNLQKKYNVMAWPTLSQWVLDRLEDFPEIKLLGKQLVQINFINNKSISFNPLVSILRSIK